MAYAKTRQFTRLYFPLTLACSLLASSVSAAPGVGAAYAFNEGTGTTTADTSGKNNTATLVNGTAWGPGRTNTGVVLDGVNDHLSVPASTSLAASNITIEAWVRKTANTPQAVIAYRSGSGSFYQFLILNNELLWNFTGSDKVHVSQGAGIQLDTWYHVAVTFNDTANTVQMFVNGVQRYTSAETKSLGTVTSPLLIGARGVSGYLPGGLDDVRFYNRALSLAEVRSDMITPVAVFLPKVLGWYEIPNTKMIDLCPNIPSLHANEGCKAITAAWGAGMLDTLRSRLLVRGGGHSTYFGNEIYALNLYSQSIERLTEPSLNPPTTCANSGIMPDGKPTSRHLFSHLAYMRHVDRMYSYSGAGVPCGSFQHDTWTLPMSNLNAWSKMSPDGDGPATTPNTARFNVVSEYDEVTRKVYLRDDFRLYSYTFETDTYEPLSAPAALSSAKVGTLDTTRNKLVLIAGGQVYTHDITEGADHSLQLLPTTGGGPILSAYFPGVAYDSLRDRVVAWDTGDTVYSLDMDTGVWTPITYLNGPTKVSNGTMGRWRYVPALGVFVVLNSFNSNAHVLRLTGGTPPPPPPPSTTVAVGNYGFSETSGDVVLDRSGKSNHGRLFGGATRGPGHTGNGLVLDGVNDIVNVPDSTSLTTPDVSIEAWIRKSANGARNIIAFKGGSGGFYRFYTTGTELGWAYAGGRNHVTARANIQVGIWNHVAISFSDANNTVKMYVNGVPIYLGTESTTLSTAGPLQLGGGLGTNYFPGAMDDVRVFDGVRTTAEIVSDMNTPLP